MTESELEELKKQLMENELYQKSHALHKEFQFQLFRNDENQKLEGERDCFEPIKDRNNMVLPVIYRFKNGFLHSAPNSKGILQPGIEYLDHWEYWTNGIIDTIEYNTAADKHIIEIWNDGLPTDIKNIEQEE